MAKTDEGTVDKTLYENAQKIKLTCLNCRSQNIEMIIISPHVIGYRCKECGANLPYYAIKQFSIEESIKRLEKIEKLVGQPADEHTKPLFEIVDALNRKVMELWLKIDKMEAKESP